MGSNVTWFDNPSSSLMILSQTSIKAIANYTMNQCYFGQFLGMILAVLMAHPPDTLNKIRHFELRMTTKSLDIEVESESKKLKVLTQQDYLPT